MTELFRVTVIFSLLILGFACYFLVLSAFFPKRLAKTENAIRQMPWRSLGIGFVNILFFGTITFVFFGIADSLQEGGNKVLSVVLLIPTVLFTGVLLTALFLGLTAVSNLLGERLFPEVMPWRKTFWGTVILGAASAIPAVGWALLFPLVALIGFGAVILGFFQKGE
jgi:hypothetical protein